MDLQVRVTSNQLPCEQHKGCYFNSFIGYNRMLFTCCPRCCLLDYIGLLGWIPSVFLSTLSLDVFFTLLCVLVGCHVKNWLSSASGEHGRRLAWGKRVKFEYLFPWLPVSWVCVFHQAALCTQPFLSPCSSSCSFPSPFQV